MGYLDGAFKCKNTNYSKPSSTHYFKGKYKGEISFPLFADINILPIQHSFICCIKPYYAYSI